MDCLIVFEEKGIEVKLYHGNYKWDTGVLSFGIHASKKATLSSHILIFTLVYTIEFIKNVHFGSGFQAKN